MGSGVYIAATGRYDVTMTPTTTTITDITDITDITATIPATDTTENWADAATDAWMSAAADAGLTATETEFDGTWDVDFATDAGMITCGGVTHILWCDQKAGLVRCRIAEREDA